ncbi:MAG: hypothetical protein KBC56_07250 [Flavobacterium sp.]|nr:hypothetical protein [Flavobacterium sp.]
METQIKFSTIKNYALILLALAVIILCFKSCNDTSENESVIALKNLENKNLQKDISIINSKNIDVEKEIAQFQDSVVKFKKEKDFLLSQISAEKAKGQKLSRQIKSFTAPDFIDYYKARYPKYVSEVGVYEDKVTLADSINTQIVNDLIFGDVGRAEVKLYEQALVKSEQASTVKDSINDKNEIIIGNLSDVISIKNKQLDNANEVVSEQLDIIRKANRTQTALKIGLGAVIIYEIVKAVIPK